MSVENLEEEGYEKNPNFQLASWKFLLSSYDHRGDKALERKLLDAIIADSKYFI